MAPSSGPPCVTRSRAQIPPQLLPVPHGLLLPSLHSYFQCHTASYFPPSTVTSSATQPLTSLPPQFSSATLPVTSLPLQLLPASHGLLLPSLHSYFQCHTACYFPPSTVTSSATQPLTSLPPQFSSATLPVTSLPLQLLPASHGLLLPSLHSYFQCHTASYFPPSTVTSSATRPVTSLPPQLLPVPHGLLLPSLHSYFQCHTASYFPPSTVTSSATRPVTSLPPQLLPVPHSLLLPSLHSYFQCHTASYFPPSTVTSSATRPVTSLPPQLLPVPHGLLLPSLHSYFQCRPLHGLFAPISKVVKFSTATAAKPVGASLSNSLSKPSSAFGTNLSRSRSGSQESLASVGSVASSVRSNVSGRGGRVRLGVTSLSNQVLHASLTPPAGWPLPRRLPQTISQRVRGRWRFASMFLSRTVRNYSASNSRLSVHCGRG